MYFHGSWRCQDPNCPIKWRILPRPFRTLGILSHTLFNLCSSAITATLLQCSTYDASRREREGMGLEKQTQEIGLKVRGFARRVCRSMGVACVPYDRDGVYFPSMSAVVPAVCSKNRNANLLCNGSLRHS
jgi:hypothetical protein